MRFVFGSDELVRDLIAPLQRCFVAAMDELGLEPIDAPRQPESESESEPTQPAASVGTRESSALAASPASAPTSPASPLERPREASRAPRVLLRPRPATASPARAPFVSEPAPRSEPASLGEPALPASPALPTSHAEPPSTARTTRREPALPAERMAELLAGHDTSRSPTHERAAARSESPSAVGTHGTSLTSSSSPSTSTSPSPSPSTSMPGESRSTLHDAGEPASREPDTRTDEAEPLPSRVRVRRRASDASDANEHAEDVDVDVEALLRVHASEPPPPVVPRVQPHVSPSPSPSVARAEPASRRAPSSSSTAAPPQPESASPTASTGASAPSSVHASPPAPAPERARLRVRPRASDASTHEADAAPTQPPALEHASAATRSAPQPGTPSPSPLASSPTTLASSLASTSRSGSTRPLAASDATSPASTHAPLPSSSPGHIRVRRVEHAPTQPASHEHGRESAAVRPSAPMPAQASQPELALRAATTTAATPSASATALLEHATSPRPSPPPASTRTPSPLRVVGAASGEATPFAPPTPPLPADPLDPLVERTLTTVLRNAARRQGIEV